MSEKGTIYCYTLHIDKNTDSGAAVLEKIHGRDKVRYPHIKDFLYAKILGEDAHLASDDAKERLDRLEESVAEVKEIIGQLLSDVEEVKQKRVQDMAADEKEEQRDDSEISYGFSTAFLENNGM